MAIAIDQSSIGTNAPGGTGTTVTLTTSATVASNAFIVLSVGWWDASTTMSTVGGGGLTWSIDKQGRSGVSPTFPNTAVVSAQAPSGLASSTVITVTFSGTTDARTISGCSFTGVATSSPVDVTDGPQAWSGAQPWSTGSMSIQAGSVIVATAWQETGDIRSVPDSPSIESSDFGNATGWGMTACYRIESSAGSYTVAGDWASNTSGKVNAAAYLAAAVSFSPSDIAGLKVWLDADQIGGLSDGDPVATWSDLSGEGNDATQGTAGARPSYETGELNGNPVLRFDGSADHLVLGDLSASFPSAVTLLIVATVGTGSYWVYDDVAGADTYWRFSGDGNGYFGTFHAGRLSGYPPSMPVSGTYVFTLQSSASVYEAFVNGVTKGTSTASYFAGFNHVIATNGELGHFAPVNVAEVLLYDTVLGASDRGDAEAYLLEKWLGIGAAEAPSLHVVRSTTRLT